MLRRNSLLITVLTAVALGSALGSAFGCDSATVPPSPSAFDRPESIGFFCWSFTEDRPVPLSECAPNPSPGDEDDIADPRPGLALHALVTQTATGEVAAVRLTGAGRGVIDTDVRVPGFTFVAVGEVPSDLTLSSEDPKHVFVVSRGSSQIHAIAIADFRKGTGAAPTDTLMLPGGARPSAVVLSPSEDALIVALPGRGQLARVPIVGDGELGEPELFDLSAAVPDPVDLTALAEDQLPPTYLYTCPGDLVTFQPAIVPPREPVIVDPAPAPWAIVYDEETGRLLISDRSLPVIHVVDPVTMTEEAPLSVSVPTRQLALTPFVPAEVGGLPTDDPSERYLYAIDDLDQSVLAIDLSDPARPTYGAVLPVGVRAPVDRLPLRDELARGLAVVSPGYTANQEPARNCVTADTDAPSGGASLYGVFLTVGTTDGNIRFFDVYDLDTACRGTVACGAVSADPDDQLVAIGRHRPRIGARLQLGEGPAVTPEPTWTAEGVGTVSVASDGTTDAPGLVPTLAPVTCDDPLAQAYPATGEALVCAIVDPWAARSERFTASYEGTIPFTATTGGNFQGTNQLVARTDFCSLGVIGVQPESDGYLGGYRGDMIAITGDLPPSVLMSDEPHPRRDALLVDFCEELTERTTTGETTPVLIQIEEAFSNPAGAGETYPGRLVLGDVIQPTGMDDLQLDDVRPCFPELLEFEVRARGAFVVQSNVSGFVHPIVAAPDGTCVVDPDRVDRDLLGRAFFDSTYDSPNLRFALGGPPAAVATPVLEIVIGDVPPPLVIDVSSLGGSNRSSLLTNLVYNDVDERLYAVDQSVQGLMRIQLNPVLSVPQAFR